LGRPKAPHKGSLPKRGKERVGPTSRNEQGKGVPSEVTINCFQTLGGTGEDASAPRLRSRTKRRKKMHRRGEALHHILGKISSLMAAQKKQDRKGTKKKNDVETTREKNRDMGTGKKRGEGP